jgi:hypothetical protein
MPEDNTLHNYRPENFKRNMKIRNKRQVLARPSPATESLASDPTLNTPWLALCPPAYSWTTGVAGLMCGICPAHLVLLVVREHVMKVLIVSAVP